MDSDLGVRLIGAAVMMAAGVALIWVAIATASGRLGKNRFAGIRIVSTMASDEAWLAGHRRAKPAMIVAGAAAIASGAVALAPLPEWAFAAAILTGCGVMLASLIYGSVIAHRAAVATTNP